MYDVRAIHNYREMSFSETSIASIDVNHLSNCPLLVGTNYLANFYLDISTNTTKTSIRRFKLFNDNYGNFPTLSINILTNIYWNPKFT